MANTAVSGSSLVVGRCIGTCACLNPFLKDEAFLDECATCFVADIVSVGLPPWC